MNKQSQYQADLPPDFDSMRAKKKESLKRQQDLLKSGCEHDKELAQRLALCNPKERCRSAACPVCFREYRKVMFKELHAFYNQHKDWRFVTLIFYSDALTSRELFFWDPAMLKKRLGRRLKRAGIYGPAIGSFEVDFHTDQQRWLPHVHLLIPWDKEGFEELHETMIKPPDMQTRPGITSKPMDVRCIKSPPGAFTYLFKSYCSRIDRYTDKTGKTRTSRKRRLRGVEHRLSLTLMDRLGFGGIRFLYGLRANGRSWEPKLSLSPRRK